VSRERAEDLGSVVHVVLVSYLVGIIQHERKIEQECNPLTRKEEKDREESVGYIFWQDKLVEFVAEIYGVDVVTLEVGEHDNEENHREEQHSGHEDREEKQPAYPSKS